MKLLLDEMISPRIARELRERGHDVQAVKKDRPELGGSSDRELIRRMADEGRTIVTNDVADYQPIHDRLLAAGEQHAGFVFTSDATLPRAKGAIALWVERLEQLLREHPSDAALHNRVMHLS